jgi:cellulose synthase/poly-beta-1,6-N-acetylglucosamine synthase-like glycosyltransferase
MNCYSFLVLCFSFRSFEFKVPNEKQNNEQRETRNIDMQQALLIILLLIFGLYVLLILYYWKSWVSIADFSPDSYREPILDFKPSTKITVIIPARNEEENIAACLDSVCNQSYPKDLFEVLVIDDHSTDNTAVIINRYADKNVKLISLKEFVHDELNSYKKKAIEIAIAQSTGELIVTTDADCFAKENWLQTIAAFYEQYNPAFIAAPVSIDCSNKFIEFFQGLDFMTLQGITGASVHKKIHSMCNGANLAYTKKAFEEAGGFTGIDNIASGDDMLLMHKIYKLHPDKVIFLKSKEAIVQTAPVNSVKDFFNQRIRWASKADKYDDKRIFVVLLLVYLVNVLLVVLPVTAIFIKSAFSISLYPFTFVFRLWELWIFLLIIKTLAELIFLMPVSKFFGKRSMLWVFPLMQPFHIIYTVIAGWLGKFGSYKWKGRDVK